jgi:hypothetical protein
VESAFIPPNVKINVEQNKKSLFFSFLELHVFAQDPASVVLLFMASRVARHTVMHHHTWLLCGDRVLLTVSPGWPQASVLPIFAHE